MRTAGRKATLFVLSLGGSNKTDAKRVILGIGTHSPSSSSSVPGGHAQYGSENPGVTQTWFLSQP